MKTKKAAPSAACDHDVSKLLMTVCAAANSHVHCRQKLKTCYYVIRQDVHACFPLFSSLPPTPTLQRLGSVLLDHDAELQDQLRRRLQEGLQQAQHVDVGVLEHHGPVPPPLVLLLPPRHDAQVQRPDVPAGGQRFFFLGSFGFKCTDTAAKTISARLRL